MKLTILFTSLFLIIGSVFYISKPTNAVGAGVITSESTIVVTPAKNTVPYSTSITIECPVVGKGLPMQPTYEFTVTDGITYYTHCNDCNTGVYLEAADTGIVRCTFCGKNK